MMIKSILKFKFLVTVFLSNFCMGTRLQDSMIGMAMLCLNRGFVDQAEPPEERQEILAKLESDHSKYEQTGKVPEDSLLPDTDDITAVLWSKERLKERMQDQKNRIIYPLGCRRVSASKKVRQKIILEILSTPHENFIGPEGKEEDQRVAFRELKQRCRNGGTAELQEELLTIMKMWTKDHWPVNDLFEKLEKLECAELVVPILGESTHYIFPDSKKNMMFPAVCSGCVEVARNLIEAGVSVKHKNRKGSSPLSLSVRLKKKPMTNMLLDSIDSLSDDGDRFSDDESCSALSCAGAVGDLDFIERMMAKGAKPSEVSYLAAARNNHDRALKLLCRGDEGKIGAAVTEISCERMGRDDVWNSPFMP
jgi:hypothetical protein